MTCTVIRSRTVIIDGREYADIVYTDTSMPRLGSWRDVRRHIYAVNSEGMTALLTDESFVSEEMGSNNWKNVHTTKKVARLKEQGHAH